jgi:hypothetical protein
MELRRHGVLTRALATGALQVSPALTIDRAFIEELTAGLAAGLASIQL